MQYDGYAEHTHAHTGTPKTLHPLEDVFRVFKLCIPLGTTLELLHLLFLVLFWLCIPLGTTFELQNLLCAPLGTTFVASELTLRSFRNDFCNFRVLLRGCIPLDDMTTILLHQIGI